MKKYFFILSLILCAIKSQSQVLPADSGLYYENKFFESKLENNHFFAAAEKHLTQKIKQDSTSYETNCNLYRLYFHTSTHMYSVIADTTQKGLKKFNSFPYAVQSSYGDSLTAIKIKAEHCMQKCTGYTGGFEFEDN